MSSPFDHPSSQGVVPVDIRMRKFNILSLCYTTCTSKRKQILGPNLVWLSSSCVWLILTLYLLVLAANTVLVVYAHQSIGSFNAAAKNVAVDFFTTQKWKVEVSDLYAMKFKAAATAEDITGRHLKIIKLMWLSVMTFFLPFVLSAGEVKDSQHFRYAEETKLAWETGKLSADLIEEQRKLTQADLVIFQVQVRKKLMFLHGSIHFFFFSSSPCTGSVFLPSWRAGSTGCSQRVMLTLTRSATVRVSSR